MRSRNLTHGFTLVELLVVISIIGILMGLLVPAVSAVRERARIMNCASNLKQLAVACTSYEAANRVLPMNWGADGTETNIRGHSWLTGILPQVDEESLYKMIKFGALLSFTSTSEKKNNMQAASFDVKAFHCPSDPTKYQDLPLDSNSMFKSQPMPGTNYKASCGSNWPIEVLQVASSSSSSGPGVRTRVGRNANRNDAPDYGNGPFLRNLKRTDTTALGDCKDGASKTIMLGEAVPQWTVWNAWYWWDGAIATCGLPLNYPLQQNTPPRPDLNYNDRNRRYGFMSRHSGGANFAFCDASSKWLGASISHEVYRALATINAEEVVDIDNGTVIDKWAPKAEEKK
jgi:prepilin-type N-terminal cleavage/methylation domain-containing protein/prepilin-type processing-associated H-X9-DG protein